MKSTIKPIIEIKGAYRLLNRVVSLCKKVLPEWGDSPTAPVRENDDVLFRVLVWPVKKEFLALRRYVIWRNHVMTEENYSLHTRVSSRCCHGQQKWCHCRTKIQESRQCMNRGLVLPEWKVERDGTFLGNATGCLEELTAGVRLLRFTKLCKRNNWLFLQ